MQHSARDVWQRRRGLALDLATWVMVCGIGLARAAADESDRSPTTPTATAAAAAATNALPCATLACDTPRFAIEPLTAAEVTAMTGVVWRPGCPVALDELRQVVVSHRRQDGSLGTGVLVVHRAIAQEVLALFRELLQQNFVIAAIAPAHHLGGDDDALMRANITSAFNCRRVLGGRGFSAHAWGLALDINPQWNPYVRRDHIAPANGAAFVVDRDHQRLPGLLTPTSPAVAAVERAGFVWGGRWRSVKDWQHIERRAGIMPSK
jgi:hypothetical protein